MPFIDGGTCDETSGMNRGSPRSAGIVGIRRATTDDLPGMARVHVETWKTTYRGIVPDAHLDGLTVESDIAHGFGRWLNEPIEGWTYLVATSPSDEIVGFALGGPIRVDPEFPGELGAIYVLKEHQGRGVGSSLVREVATHLTSIGIHSMLVWVLEANTYRRFYAKLGAMPMRRRVARVAGAMLPELGYGWKDLRRLTSPLRQP